MEKEIVDMYINGTDIETIADIMTMLVEDVCDILEAAELI